MTERQSDSGFSSPFAARKSAETVLGRLAENDYATVTEKNIDLVLEPWALAVLRLSDLAEWLVALDDPEDVIGREDRRTVTLTKIIERARDALRP